MRHFVLPTAFAAALATSSLVLAQAQNPQGQPQNQPGQTSAQQWQSQQASARQQPQLSKDDEKRYIKEMSSDNQLEIQLGQYVQSKNVDPQIKQFAQRTATDHQQAEDKLKQVAQQSGEKAPEKLNHVDRAVLSHMKDLPEQDLGREYVFFQVANHQKDLLTNQYVANHAQDTNIKNYAQQMASSLQQHYQHAQELAQAQFGTSLPGAQPAGATFGGQQQGGYQGQSGQQPSGQQPGQSGY